MICKAIQGKFLVFILFSIALGLLPACDKDRILNIQPEDIIGRWSSEDVSLHGENADLVNWFGSGVFLILESDGFFARNYVSGDWGLEANQLTLTPQFDLGKPTWTYTVIDFDTDMLFLEAKMTECMYCCDLEEFASDEELIVRERFVRLE